uniref:Rhodopsin n=2 Tax=Gasterosteus aculeatus aculeatus TaxID=481459 RepID=A0AAQ4P498_GASAC
MAAVPPLAGWSRCVPEDQQGCCGPDCYKTNNKYNNGPYFMFLFCFSVPFCTIVFCCSHRQHPQQAAKAQAESASTQKAEREVAGMVVVMVLGFLVCWRPFASFALWVINNHWNPFDWQPPPLNKQVGSSLSLRPNVRPVMPSNGGKIYKKLLLQTENLMRF